MPKYPAPPAINSPVAPYVSDATMWRHLMKMMSEWRNGQFTKDDSRKRQPTQTVLIGTPGGARNLDRWIVQRIDTIEDPGDQLGGGYDDQVALTNKKPIAELLDPQWHTQIDNLVILQNPLLQGQVAPVGNARFLTVPVNFELDGNNDPIDERYRYCHVDPNDPTQLRAGTGGYFEIVDSYISQPDPDNPAPGRFMCLIDTESSQPLWQYELIQAANAPGQFQAKLLNLDDEEFAPLIQLTFVHVPNQQVGDKGLCINVGNEFYALGDGGGAGGGFWIRFACQERFGQTQADYVTVNVLSQFGTVPLGFDPGQPQQCFDVLGIWDDLQVTHEGLAIWTGARFEIIQAQRLAEKLLVTLNSELLAGDVLGTFDPVEQVVWPVNPFSYMAGLSLIEASNDLKLDAVSGSLAILKRRGNYDIATGRPISAEYYIEHVYEPHARTVMAQANAREVVDPNGITTTYTMQVTWYNHGTPPAGVGQVWSWDVPAGTPDYMYPYVGPGGGANTDLSILEYDTANNEYKPVGFEQYIARFGLAQWNWPDPGDTDTRVTLTTLQGFDGYQPTSTMKAELYWSPECPGEGMAEGYVFFDRNLNKYSDLQLETDEKARYHVVSTQSALIGKPKKITVRSEEPSTGSGGGNIGCGGGETCFDVNFEYKKKKVYSWDCDFGAGSDTGIDSAEICISSTSFLDCVDICEYVCEYCPGFAGPDGCDPICGTCTYVWSAAEQKWVEDGNDCDGSTNCVCQPPTSPGTDDGEILTTNCSNDDPPGDCEYCTWKWDSDSQSWEVQYSGSCGPGCYCNDPPFGGGPPPNPGNDSLYTAPCDTDPPDPPDCAKCEFLWNPTANNGDGAWEPGGVDACTPPCECPESITEPPPTDPLDPNQTRIQVDCEIPEGPCPCVHCPPNESFSVTELTATLDGISGYTMIGGPYIAEDCVIPKVNIRWAGVTQTIDAVATVTFTGTNFVIETNPAKHPETNTAGRWVSDTNLGCTSNGLNCNTDGDCGEWDIAQISTGGVQCPQLMAASPGDYVTVTMADGSKRRAKVRRREVPSASARASLHRSKAKPTSKELNANLGLRTKHLFPQLFRGCKSCGIKDAMMLLNSWQDNMTDKRLSRIVDMLYKARKGRNDKNSIKTMILRAMATTIPADEAK